MFVTVTSLGVVELPPLATVPESVLRGVLSCAPQDRVLHLIESITSRPTMNTVDGLPLSEFNDVVKRWETDAGISVDELLSLAVTISTPSHREGLEADLIGKGMRLRHFPSEDYTWRDLKVFVRHLDVHSGYYAAVYPERAGWDQQNMLLALQIDYLAILAWQRTRDGRKGRNKPAQLPRPGVVPEPRDGSRVKAIPRSEMQALMAKRRAASAQAEARKTLGHRRPAEHKPTLEQIFGGG